MRKFVLNSDQEKLLKFEAEGRDFAKILGSQFFAAANAFFLTFS